MVGPRVLSAIFYKGTYPIHEGSTLMTQSPIKGTTSWYYHFGGLGFQIMNLGEHNIHAIAEVKHTFWDYGVKMCLDVHFCLVSDVAKLESS